MSKRTPNLGNSERVRETAEFIRKELHVLLDRMNYDSHLSIRLRESCSAYKNLTNIERTLATLRALAMTQADVITDIETMTWPDQEDREEWDVTEENDAAAEEFMRLFEEQNPGSAPS